MTSISGVSNRKGYEIQQKEQNQEKRRVDKEFQEVIDTTTKKHNQNLKKMETFYSDQMAQIKNDVERKLNELRVKQKETIIKEELKNEEEVNDLKKNHADLRREIIEGQQLDIERLKEVQSRYLDNAKRSYEKHLSKYKTT
jgi:hypothetical protein